MIVDLLIRIFPRYKLYKSPFEFGSYTFYKRFGYSLEQSLEVSRTWKLHKAKAIEQVFFMKGSESNEEIRNLLC
jgi:hypothetical protein